MKTLVYATPQEIEKWLPLIEGTGNWKDFVSACPKIRHTDYALMARLFENFESQGAEKELHESTTSGDVTGSFNPILIAMMRRTLPAQIGSRIFGTQPMNGPTGTVFAARAVFGNDTNTPVNRTNSVILILADATAFAVGDSIASTDDDTVADPTETAVGTVLHKDSNTLLVKTLSGTWTVGEEVQDAATVAQNGGVTTISAVLENEALFKVVLPSYTGPYSTANGEALAKDMKEMSLRIDQTTVTATTSKVKAKWSQESEDDIRAIHKMSAESMLQQIASDEIIMEMNRRFIDYVDGKVTYTSSFDYTTADGLWEGHKYGNLVNAISRSQMKVSTQSYRGRATWAIVSPAVLAALETSGRLDKTGTDPINEVYCGRCLNMDIFVNMYAADDSVLLGYKKDDFDAGIFYCPYIPLRITKGYGEEDGQPRAFFTTRYAIADNPFGAAYYIHKLTVANLPA
jgi:hypothetical protein